MALHRHTVAHLTTARPTTDHRTTDHHTTAHHTMAHLTTRVLRTTEGLEDLGGPVDQVDLLANHDNFLIVKIIN